MAYLLERHEGLAAGLRRVAVEQAAAAAEHLSTDPDPAAAVHEARKRSKEARAALRLLRQSLGSERESAARARYRDAARSVSPIRDAEAAVETLDHLRRHQRLLLAERAPAERALRQRRNAAEAAITGEKRGELAAAFAAAAAALPRLSHATPDSVADSLARVYRRGRRRMRAALGSGAAEDYHAWRKATKDLWYAVRLFEPAWPGPLGILAGELHELSQLLGQEHDLTMLRAALLEAGGEPPLLTARLDRAITRRQRHLRERSHEAGERLWAERPGALARRILGYWTSWRQAAR